MCIRDRGLGEDEEANLISRSNAFENKTVDVLNKKDTKSVRKKTYCFSGPSRSKRSSNLRVSGSQCNDLYLSLIHISEPTRPLYISYAVFCLKKKKQQQIYIPIVLFYAIV
eukprot:TRINITY_DN25977_c0_g1_i1.p1 TRINITY_DN25977_c0_g1~~TRINITY_DN25977_c0_g1_i1.p1  ORF type:complete len:111 (+),score=16.58 TRINITY_DN25977_c0_g1_i1:91-423(+)